MLDRVQRGMVAGVALVLPDVDEGVAVADFSAPGAYKMDLNDLSALPKDSLWACDKIIPYSPAFQPYADTSFQPIPHTRRPCPA